MAFSKPPSRQKPGPTDVAGSTLNQAVKIDFHEFLISGPKVDDFEIERDKDTGREIDLSE